MPPAPGSTPLASGVPTQDAQGTNHSQLRRPHPLSRERGGKRLLLAGPFRSRAAHTCARGGPGAPSFLTHSLNDAQPSGGFGWEGAGPGASEGRGQPGEMTSLPSLTALAYLGQPPGQEAHQLVLSYFSPRSCRKNAQLHVPAGHREQSDGAARHGPAAGVHRLRGVRTTSPHFWPPSSGGCGGELVRALSATFRGTDREADSPPSHSGHLSLDSEERRRAGMLCRLESLWP